MGNSDNIYKFENVEFTTTAADTSGQPGGGSSTRSWAVTSIVMLLDENALPTVTLRIDPIHTAYDISSATPVSKLSEIGVWNTEIQKLAQAKAKASLMFEIWHKNPTGDGYVMEQNVTLTDWVVVSSGITSGAKNGFIFEIQIQHPLARASFIGTSIANIVTHIDDRVGSIVSSNIVAAIVDTLKVYQNVKFTTAYLETACVSEPGLGVASAPESGTMSATAIVDKFREDMAALASLLETHLKWTPDYYSSEAGAVNYSDWPFTDTLFKGAEAKYAYMVSLMLWGIRDSDMWGFLVNNLFPEFNLTLIPTFWKELSLVPTTPWAAPKHQIYDIDISAFDFPGYERNMISGVIAVDQHAGMGTDTSFFKTKNGDGDKMTEGIIYRPNTTLDGALVDMSVPPYLLALKSMDAGMAGEYTSFASPTNETQTPANGAVADTPQVTTGTAFDYQPSLYRCAAYHCAHQLFLTLFRSGTQGSATCRVLTKSNGEFILPGDVVEFISKDVVTGTTVKILEAYLTRVVHDIDFGQGGCQTQLAFKYVRPPGGFPDTLSVPTTNPVYDRGAQAPA